MQKLCWEEKGRRTHVGHGAARGLLKREAFTRQCAGRLFGHIMSIQQRRGASAGDRMDHTQTAALSGVSLFKLF